jgi:biopolymer transport protein ExbD
MGKPKRANLRLDMTAMVDVAFLLLTFFMLTTQFKPPEAVEIDVPSSHAEVKLPGTDLMTIAVAEDGRIFLSEEPNPQVQVSLDDLHNAIVEIRSGNPEVRTVIKADAGADYGVVEDVMEVLKEARITRFSLVTDLETEDAG